MVPGPCVTGIPHSEVAMSQLHSRSPAVLLLPAAALAIACDVAPVSGPDRPGAPVAAWADCTPCWPTALTSGR